MYRNWVNVFPLSLVMAGFWIGQHFEHTFDVWFTVIALQLHGVMIAWQINVALTLQHRHNLRLMQSQIKTDPAPALGNGFVSIRNLNTPNTLESVAVNVQQRDPRIKQWAMAVTYSKTPMTQSRWAGGGKPFSKPEYAAWTKVLLEREVIALANPKNTKGGYKPNGAKGWQYLKALADGREYLPLPTVDRSKSEHLWLGA